MARDWKTTYAASAAAAQHTAPFSAPAVAGHGLIAIAVAPASVAVPAGWAEHVDPLGIGELSCASRVAAGGETQILWDRDPASSTAPRTLAGWVESRDDVGDLVGTPIGYPEVVAVGGALDFGGIATTVGGCRIYVAVSQISPSTAWSPVWSGATGEDVIAASGNGFESVRLAVATVDAPTAGTYPVSVSGLAAGQPYQAAIFVLGPTQNVEEPPPTAETAIEAENRLQGTPKGTWDIAGAGSMTIQGYATSMSVARGATLSVKVHSPASAWTGTVYRLGWYGGDGARQVGTISGPQTTQPDGTVDPTTLMTSCANWTINGTWAAPADATPGIYLIKIARNDNAALASHIGPFVVRDPARKAPITVKLSDTTWQAYNHAGPNPADPLAGRSIYGTGTASAFTFNQATRARAVSYDRPVVTRQHLPQTAWANAEYPLWRWLERLGYDLDYVSCLDVQADPTLLLGRDVVISAGHDEYWSPEMVDAAAASRDHSTAASSWVWLSGNEAFWRVNFASGNRSYACWKDTHDGALNPSGVYSGTWQDARSINPDRRPAALLNGQRFRLNGISAYALGAKAAHATKPLWRDTPVAALSGSATWTSPVGIVGFEADEPADTSLTEKPAGLIRLSEVTYAVTGMLADDNGDTYSGTGSYIHAMTAYPSAGGMVFHAGTVQYSWALDDVHDRHPGGSLASAPLQQALTNLIADLGQVPPEYGFPAGLALPEPVPLTAYGFPDSTAPTAPTGLQATPATTSVTLTWSAAADDVSVAGYDLYRDGVLVQSGLVGLSYAFTGLTEATAYLLGVRARDAAGNTSSTSTVSTATLPAEGAVMLITPAELAAKLDVDLADLDMVKAQQDIASASEWVESVTGHAFTTRTTTVRLPAPRSQQLVIPLQPLREVSSASIDGTAVTGMVTTGSGVWRAAGWRTSWMPQAVEATVVYGFSVTPADIKAVVREVAAEMHEGKITAESIDDYRVQYATGGGLSSTSERTLAAYGAGPASLSMRTHP